MKVLSCASMWRTPYLCSKYMQFIYFHIVLRYVQYAIPQRSALANHDHSVHRWRALVTAFLHIQMRIHFNHQIILYSWAHTLYNLIKKVKLVLISSFCRNECQKDEIFCIWNFIDWVKLRRYFLQNWYFTNPTKRASFW